VRRARKQKPMADYRPKNVARMSQRLNGLSQTPWKKLPEFLKESAGHSLERTEMTNQGKGGRTLYRQVKSGVLRQLTRKNHSGRAFQKRRSSARLREQPREYFEVRFRAEKYGVPYFLAKSEAKQSDPRKEAAGARARNAIEDFKWRAPTRSVGRRQSKP
jgi:hypothetical protein